MGTLPLKAGGGRVNVSMYSRKQKQYQKDMKQLVGEEAVENVKLALSLVITLKTVLHISLPLSLIPASRLDHSLRKLVPSAGGKDETRFMSSRPTKRARSQPLQP